VSPLQSFFAENGGVLFWSVLAYLAVISLISAVVTVADKLYAGRPGHRRVPESTLLLYAAFGGSASMLLTMLLIRHKTKHIKFMLGIPLILLFQAVVALWVAMRLL
jgi:uncharacterized membrane protein YsdA (DUF1294 family)